MQIKKLFTFILIILILCGCGEEKEIFEELPENNSPYIDPITETDAIQELSEGTIKRLNNYFIDVNDALCGESLDLIGKTIDFYDLKANDLYGNEIDFSIYKDKKILVEVAATYCTHCGENLKYMSRIKDNLGDVDIIQIFADREGNSEKIYEFYSRNNHKITDDSIIIPYNYDLVDRIVSFGITQTPTFMFIDSGVIKTALSSFSSKNLVSVCKVAFSGKIKRENIFDKYGRPLEAFFRSRQTLINEIKQESKDYLSSLHISNVDLTADTAGVYFDFYGLTSDYDDGYIDKDSYLEYENADTIVFGITRDNKDDLISDITIINEFLDNNKEINGLIVFLDDTEFFMESTSSIYLDSNIQANCPVVSSRSSVPYQIDDIAYTYMYKENSPMILFIENNYTTGMCVGIESLNNLETLKDMFYGDNCITLKANLNQNY